MPSTGIPKLRMTLIVTRGVTFNCPVEVYLFPKFKKEPKIELKFNSTSSVHETGKLQFDMKTTLKSVEDKKPIFDIELHHIGLFEVTADDTDEAKALVAFEASRLIFPYIQREIAMLTANAGFPGLNLPPIEFKAPDQ